MSSTPNGCADPEHCHERRHGDDPERACDESSATQRRRSTNNTSIAVYGGDLLGNLWRFDINGDVGAGGYDAQLLANLQDANADAQPITAPPTVITYNGTTIVYAGTGRFLGTSDVSDTQTQSFYADQGPMGTTAYGNIRASGSWIQVQQTLYRRDLSKRRRERVLRRGGDCPDNSSSNAVDWTTQNGWYHGLPDRRRACRQHPSLELGTVAFTTIRPASASANACGISTDTAASFLYALDYTTGGAIPGTGGVAGVSLGSGLATAPTVVELPGGIVKVIVRVADGSGTGTDMGGTRVLQPPIKPPVSTGGTRRVSWRELPTQ